MTTRTLELHAFLQSRWSPEFIPYQPPLESGIYSVPTAVGVRNLFRANRRWSPEFIPYQPPLESGIHSVPTAVGVRN